MQKTERTVEEITQYLEEQLDSTWTNYERLANQGHGYAQYMLTLTEGHITTLENILEFITGEPRN